MATLIIGTAPSATFGTMTNQMVSRLISVNTQMVRLQEAIATAAVGYEGVEGTEFEAPAPGQLGQGTNLFSVEPKAGEPGANGVDYRYAMDSLSAAWTTFWTAARPYLEQLDNGASSL